jgi:hypothetical protein
MLRDCGFTVKLTALVCAVSGGVCAALFATVTLPVRVPTASPVIGRVQNVTDSPTAILAIIILFANPVV